MDKYCLELQEYSKNKIAYVVERLAEKELMNEGDLYRLEKRFNGDFRPVIELFTFLCDIRPEYYHKYENDFISIVKHMLGPTNTGCIGFYPYLFEIFLIKNKALVSNELMSLIKEFLDKYYDWSVNEAYDFVGVNDNTPAMIMTQLYLYGELCGDGNAKKVALCRLGQFEEMLNTRAFISEFSSPSYSPITVKAFAVLAELAANESVKKRALKCEEEVIGQLFKMYNRHTGTISGPYSRAYNHDSQSGMTQIAEFFYLLTGKYAPYDIVEQWFNDGMITEQHYHSIAQLSSYALFKYDFPKSFIEDAINKELPYSVSGDAQVSSSFDYHLLKEYSGEESINGEDLSMLSKTDDLEEYQSTVTVLNTYFNNWYSLGTCTKEFHCGNQTDSLQIGVWDKERIEKVSDASTVFTKMLINGRSADHSGFIRDCGRKIACSEKNIALLSYTPKTMVQDIESIKMCFLTNYNFDCDTGLYYDGKKLEENKTFKWNKTVYFKFRKCYAAIIPPKGSELEAVVEGVSDNLSFSVIYYEGAKKHFYKKELKLICAGAAVEVGSDEEYGSFEAFCKKLDTAFYEDRLYTNLHLRYTFERKLSYINEKNSLKMCISPVSEGIKYIRANDKTIV